MPLTLYVDGDRWRDHLRRTLADRPNLVPVAKGNGYGFGNARLARRAEWLGVDTLAVGTYDEVPDVARRFPGDLLVLNPWRPFAPGPDDPALADRLLHTVGRLEDLEALAALRTRPRVVVELVTSMLRHGLTPRDLQQAAGHLRGIRLEGVAIHLPLSGAGHGGEVEALLTAIVAAGLPTGTVWTSHLGSAEVSALATSYPDFTFRSRIGTQLWLGDRQALHARATVLDVHRVERGQRYGYRGRRAARAGYLLVVSGGTAHGIGLESPLGQADLRGRASALARGGLDAAGLARSPYSVGGTSPRVAIFAEPPHMQASMLTLPHGLEPPEVGAELDVRVRYTTTAFDRVLISGS